MFLTACTSTGIVTVLTSKLFAQQFSGYVLKISQHTGSLVTSLVYQFISQLDIFFRIHHDLAIS